MSRKLILVLVLVLLLMLVNSQRTGGQASRPAYVSHAELVETAFSIVRHSSFVISNRSDAKRITAI